MSEESFEDKMFFYDKAIEGYKSGELNEDSLMIALSFELGMSEAVEHFNYMFGKEK